MRIVGPRQLLIALVIAVGSTSSAAADWQYAGTGGTGALAQFDAETFKVVGDVVSVWVEYDFSRDRNEQARSAKSKIEINCASRTTRTLSIIRYAPSGRVMHDYKNPYSQFEEIIPESLGDEMATRICDYKNALEQRLERLKH